MWLLRCKNTAFLSIFNTLVKTARKIELQFFCYSRKVRVDWLMQHHYHTVLQIFTPAPWCAKAVGSPKLMRLLCFSCSNMACSVGSLQRAVKYLKTYSAYTPIDKVCAAKSGSDVHRRVLTIEVMANHSPGRM